MELDQSTVNVSTHTVFQLGSQGSKRQCRALPPLSASLCSEGQRSAWRCSTGASQ